MKKIRLRPGHVLRSVDEIRGRLHLARDRALWRALEKASASSASTGCTYHELDLLYRYVLEHRPARILELGAGISTIVLAYAGRRVEAEGGTPSAVVSMEENAFYHADLGRLIPDEVRGYVQVILSPVEDREHPGGLIGRRYTETPPGAYDLVFIDGPQVPKYAADPRYFDADLLDAVAWNEGAFTALIDDREGTRENLRKLLPWARHQYDARHRMTRITVPAASERR